MQVDDPTDGLTISDATTDAPSRDTLHPDCLPGGGWAASDEELDRLVRAIESEIVPRLVIARGLAHHDKALAAWPAPTTVRPADEDAVVEFVALLAAGDAAGASAFVHARCHAGLSLDRLCLDLLAPAARRLGTLWEEDRADFTQVTVGLCELQRLMRDLALAMRPELEPKIDAPTVLLVPAPGEQHMFGVLMVAEFFRRGGWQVCSEFPRSHTELLSLLGRLDPVDSVGLSVAREELLPGLGNQIREIRMASRNKQVSVLVGGRIFADRPGLAAEVGADGTAADGRNAVALASQLYQQQRISN
jgi:methanogenic corrinoid protein MtbC1